MRSILPPDRAHGRDDGFALIEVIVSLVLVVLLLSLAPAAFRVARDAMRAEAQIERAAALVAARTVLSTMLAEAQAVPQTPGAPLYQVYFEGRSDRLTLVAPAPRALEGHGLEVITLSVSTDARTGRRQLVLQMQPYRSSEAAPGATASHRLIDDIDTLAFRYFGGAEDEPKWRVEWVGQAALPRLIEVTVSLAGSDRGLAPIVIAPRLAP